MLIAASVMRAHARIGRNVDDEDVADRAASVRNPSRRVTTACINSIGVQAAFHQRVGLARPAEGHARRRRIRIVGSIENW